MTLHKSTFEYLKPTEKQTQTMMVTRAAALEYWRVLELNIPDGPDKTYTLRALRDVSMWVNIAITRNPDGSPRADPEPTAGEAVRSPEASFGSTQGMGGAGAYEGSGNDGRSPEVGRAAG